MPHTPLLSNPWIKLGIILWKGGRSNKISVPSQVPPVISAHAYRFELTFSYGLNSCVPGLVFIE